MLADCDRRAQPLMTMAYKVAAAYRCAMAGVISVDGSCRPQIVADGDIGAVRRAAARGAPASGASARCSNTSFNIHGEPLVCTPAEALDVFLRSGADALAIGPFLVSPADA